MRKDDLEPDITEQESTIFGQHRRAEELRQEQKEEKRRERQALARELAARTGESRRITLVMSIILAVLVVCCAAVVVYQLWPQPKDMDPDKGYFVSDGTLPELSQEGILAELNEAYYTNDGCLALELKLSNGLPSPQALTGFFLTVRNSVGEVIATGQQSADWDSSSLIVPPNGYEDLTVYIPPEDVLLKDDSLYNITVEYDFEGLVEDPSVLATTTAPAQ